MEKGFSEWDGNQDNCMSRKGGWNPQLWVGQGQVVRSPMVKAKYVGMDRVGSQDIRYRSKSEVDKAGKSR